MPENSATEVAKRDLRITSFKLPRALLEELRVVARDSDLSQSQIVRRALRAELAHMKQEQA